MQEQTQNLNPSSLASIFGKISKVSIYLLVFLFPIFFLPWTVNVLDFNKQILLFILSFISFASWGIKVLIDKELKISFNLIFIVISLFLVSVGLSTIFSSWQYGSFWGWPLQVGGSLFSLIGLILLFFLIVNIFREKNNIIKLLTVLSISVILAGVYGLFQLFGKFLLPFSLTEAETFNTISNVNGMSLFMAGMIPVFIGLMMYWRKALRMLMGLGLALSVLFILLVNFNIAFWVVAIEMIFLIVFLSVKKEINFRWLFIPITILSLMFLFGIFKIADISLSSDVLEISPSQATSLSITKNVLKDNLFLGSGPGTFLYDFAKYKPETMNQGLFWNTTFSSSVSRMLNILSEIGMLGFLFFVSLMVLVGFFGYWFLLKNKESQQLFFVGLGILSCWVGLTIAGFFYPFALSLEFIWWVTMAAFIGLFFSRIRSFELKSSSYRTPLTFLVILFIILIGTMLAVNSVKRHIANVSYVKLISEVNAGNIDGAINKIDSIISLDPKNDFYWRNISQIYVLKLNRDFGNENVSSGELQILIGNAINSIKNATDYNPNNFNNWLNRGDLYKFFIGGTDGADEWALKSYREAKLLQPKNPLIPTQIGIIYINQATMADNETEKNGLLDKALDELDEAITLKSDYAPAHFQIAVVYDLQGKTKELIEKLKETKGVAPYDTGLAFQLGLVYYRNDQYDKAKGELERAVSLDANYSNARYFLGLIYDMEGETEKAIEQFVKIEEFNSDNEEVKTILSNLRLGKSALENISSSEDMTVPIPEDSQTY